MPTFLRRGPKVVERVDKGAGKAGRMSTSLHQFTPYHTIPYKLFPFSFIQLFPVSFVWRAHRLNNPFVGWSRSHDPAGIQMANKTYHTHQSKRRDICRRAVKKKKNRMQKAGKRPCRVANIWLLIKPRSSEGRKTKVPTRQWLRGHVRNTTGNYWGGGGGLRPSTYNQIGSSPRLRSVSFGRRSGLFISSLRLMCKCAKSDCIIMQMPRHNVRLMNYSDFPAKGQKW